MEGFLNRYRDITVLLLVIFAQLILLAVQVKNDQDVRLIRLWTVSAVTPMARILEGVRGGGVGFIRNYVTLHNTNAENRRLLEENGRLKLENNFLKNELGRADRAKALEVFQSHTPSRMLAATIIAIGAGANSKIVFVDRGSGAGVMRGMAVVTPDGIVGKVIAAYPTASQVMLITDADFAAGVMSQKSQVRATLKGDGTPLCRVDYVPLEEKLAPGEWFYTSGDDRVFPQGFPAGVIKSVRPGAQFQEILVEPSGLQRGLEDVLIVLQGTHQEIPDTPPVNQPIYIAPPPPGSNAPVTAVPSTAPAAAGTEADRLRSAYQAVGEAQNHNFGEGAPGSKPPDFTRLPATGAPPGRGTANPPPVNSQAPDVRPEVPPVGRGPANPPPSKSQVPGVKPEVPPSTPPDQPATQPRTPPPANSQVPGVRPGGPPSAPPDRPATQPRTPPPANSQVPVRPEGTPSTPPDQPATQPRTPPPAATQAPAGRSQRPLVLPLGSAGERKLADPAKKPADPAKRPVAGEGAADAARRANQAAGAPKGPSH